MNYRIYLLLLCLSFTYIFSFSQTNLDAAHQMKTDYADLSHWSIQSNDAQHQVDVFFVHPTTYGSPSNGNYLADLNDENLNRLTDENAINRMTAAFSDNCNVFAPRYRQMNIEVLSFDESEKDKYLAVPTEDITAALVYFLENLNHGRPFILAGHSQGSNILQAIILNNPDIINHEQLVAAYLPGWTFTTELLNKMKLQLATTANETGGLVTWNTIGPGGKSPTLKAGALCVNPLSWTIDTTPYPASLNTEARILFTDGSEERIPHFTAAKINSDGGLEIPELSPKNINRLNMSMGPNCFHSYDYDFFFQNIADNVALRCNAYLEAHQFDDKE